MFRMRGISEGFAGGLKTWIFSNTADHKVTQILHVLLKHERTDERAVPPDGQRSVFDVSLRHRVMRDA